jgi:hypothetical protein
MHTPHERLTRTTFSLPLGANHRLIAICSAVPESVFNLLALHHD